jgi:acyl-CoA synthetase (AMP-forming)/AMP-acid ligase II
MPSIAEIHTQLTAPGAPFEMVEADVCGLRLRTWKSAPPSLRAILDGSRLHGERTFLVYEDERWSFEEHWRAAAALARALVHDWGVRKGDRVAIAMRNFPEWSAAFWGAAAAGAVVVPLNAWWTGDELEYGLADSGSVVAFCDAERAERIAPFRKALPLRAVVVAKGEAAAGERRFEDLVAGPAPTSPSPTSPSLPTTTPPSSTPRAPRAGRRGPSAPTATCAPTW